MGRDFDPDFDLTTVDFDYVHKDIRELAGKVFIAALLRGLSTPRVVENGLYEFYWTRNRVLPRHRHGGKMVCLNCRSSIQLPAPNSPVILLRCTTCSNYHTTYDFANNFAGHFFK